jgi:carbon monoxide dehydrogenase subunit G
LNVPLDIEGGASVSVSSGDRIFAHYTRLGRANCNDDGKVCYDTRCPEHIWSAPKPIVIMNHSGTFRTTRSAEDVFDLVADPQRFAALLPDFESISVQDATHFTLRIKIIVGQISGHANLAMELRAAERPSRLEYGGQGIVGGSQLNFAMQFQLDSMGSETQVDWKGEVAVDGMLAMMAGGIIDSMGRRNFEATVERLQGELRANAATVQDLPPDSEPFS